MLNIYCACGLSFGDWLAYHHHVAAVHQSRGPARDDPELEALRRAYDDSVNEAMAFIVDRVEAHGTDGMRWYRHIITPALVHEPQAPLDDLDESHTCCGEPFATHWLYAQHLRRAHQHPSR